MLTMQYCMACVANSVKAHRQENVILFHYCEWERAWNLLILCIYLFVIVAKILGIRRTCLFDDPVHVFYLLVRYA
jgi:hypothetical protein